MCTWNQMFKAMELAEKEWKRTNPVYWKDGNAYRKLKRNEVIAEGAMQSYCNGELNPCLGIHTVGDMPSSFSDDRDFYNPVDTVVLVTGQKSMGDFLREHINE